MPIPVYIVCCESQSVDAATGLISHFNIFNQLNVAAVAPGESITPTPTLTMWFKMTASATWMRGDDDEDEFEFQTVLIAPGKPESKIAEGRFTFSKQFQRIDSIVMGQIFTESGTFFVDSRIRKVGSDTWFSQRYYILVEAQLAPPQQ
jgi:hypothetical protein